MLVAAARLGTQNSASETHFRVRRPRPVVPAEQSLQTTSFRAKALNSRGLWAPGTQGGSRRLPGGAEGIRTSDLRSLPHGFPFQPLRFHAAIR
jgi:hypothetical protein